MREFSVPVAYAVQPGDNITDDLVRNAENWPGAVGLKRRVNGHLDAGDQFGHRRPGARCWQRARR